MNRTSSSAAASLLFAGVLVAGIAAAYPDGAPWGSADPAAEETCASCHDDYDPVFDSDAITIEGLPESLRAGRSYPFTLVFESTMASTSGFQLLIRTTNDRPGELAAGANDIEVAGAAARSTSPRPIDGRVSWSLEWRTPNDVAGAVEFIIAASSANDDGSALGDTIHYRSIGSVVD